MPLTAGDIIILTHGDAHLMGNGPPVTPVDTSLQMRQILSEGRMLSQLAGGGEVTKLICGYLTCDAQLCRVVLAGLPAMLKVNSRYAVGTVAGKYAPLFSRSRGGPPVPEARRSIAKLSSVVRRNVATLHCTIAHTQTGWLAGVRDPDVGKALALLHQQPARPWTIAALAAEVEVSRSVLAERFQHFLADTPIGYLTRWRLHLAAQLLPASKSVAEVAGDIGYESEPSFNRAFKREFGLPPARFRTQAKSPKHPSGGRESTTAELKPIRRHDR